MLVFRIVRFIFVIIVIGIGIRRTISMSNTRKMTARRKNRSEKGIRAEAFGSKPHSKGVLFSELGVVFIDRKTVAIIKRIGKGSVKKIIFMDVVMLTGIGLVYIFGLKVQCLLKLSSVYRSVRG